jgi:pimeloyl-ACP methyl ester carboxylesterase
VTKDAGNISKLDPREEHYWIAGPHAGLRLFLRRLEQVPEGSEGLPRVVLYVHGATFPSALSIAHRFDGRSWRDALCEAGFTVWGLDFHGFGGSDRYPEMDAPADAHGPLCRSDDATWQLEAAVRFILHREGVARVALLAHSWGTMVAGQFAGAHPDLVERLAFFAPITRRDPSTREQSPAPAWRVVTAADQYKRFVEDVPASEPQVLSRRHFEDWAERYLESDPDSGRRDPAGVKVPTGPGAEIARAWAGELAYDPGLIRAPTAILRGEWDSLVTDGDARWLWDALTHSPVKLDGKIGRGTHLMHLESARLALWRESIAFLSGDDVAPVAA